MASTIENAINLAKLLGGGGTTTTSTTSNLTTDQVNSLIKKQLESTSGLASITGAEKAAGLYNSTVASQLTNDLVSSTATEMASKAAGSTTTQTASGLSGTTALTGLGLLALTDDTFKKTAKQGITSLADIVSSVNTDAMPEIANATYTGVDNIGIGDLANYFGEAASTVQSAGSSAWDWFTSLWGK